MAHFMNEKGANISHSILRVAVGQDVTIGVYGAAGLTVGPNNAALASIAPQGKDGNHNYWYVLSGSKVGNVMVEARQGASVWDYFQLAITPGLSAPPVTGEKLTGSVGVGGRNFPADVLLVKRLLASKMKELFSMPPLAINSDGNDPIFHQFIREYQRSVLGQTGDGRVDPGGRTFVTLCAPSGMPGTIPPRRADGRFTTHENEVAAEQTIVHPQQLLDLLKVRFKEVNQLAHRVLTAQAMLETGDGKSCYKWNVGNIISTVDKRHMYLTNVSNCLSPGTVKLELDTGLAHLATSVDTNFTVRCKDGHTRVVFHPPHPKTRFRAFFALEDGAAAWLGTHRTYANDFNYATALNKGDVRTVAAIMKQRGYYEADENAYAERLRGALSAINLQLARR
jgi:hypothetical protein